MSGEAKFDYSGSFTNSQFGGDGSTFTQNVSGAPDAAVEMAQLRSLITELTALIAARADQIDHPERATRDAEEILDEAGRPPETRDGGRISDAFRRLRARLGPISDFAESMGKLAEFLGKIISL